MGEVKNILEYLGGYCPIMWEQYIQYGIGRPVSGPPHQHFTFLQIKYLSLVCIKCFLVFFYVFDMVKYTYSSVGNGRNIWAYSIHGTVVKADV